MPYQKISLQVKQSIIDAYRRDEDYLAAAALLNVKRTTAHGILSRYIATGLVMKPRGGRREQSSKWDDKMCEHIVEIVQNHPAYTLIQINNQLRRDLPAKPRVSISSLSNMLDGRLISTKKLEDAPIERNTVSQKRTPRICTMVYG